MRQRGQLDSAIYSEYCKKLKQLLRISENSYHKKKFNEHKFNSKKKWNHLNTVMGRKNSKTKIGTININNKPLENRNDIANAFVTELLHIPIVLKEQLRCLTADELKMKFDIPMNSKTFFFAPVTAEEVMKVTQGLKNNSSLNDIPSKFIKLIIPFLANILADMFNECISSSYYPVCIMNAIVEPRFKSGDKTIISNYRPITLIEFICKILEKLIFNRIYSFFIENKLISSNQFGFMKHKSTAQANLQLIHHSLPAIKDNTFTISIYLDLSKAFDCVDIEILMEKFERYGIRGSALTFLKSYLYNRKIRVKIDENIYSDIKNVTMGVPQGSCLGPLFYLIYCNDLNNIITDVKIINYADDIVLVLNGSNIAEMVKIMNDTLYQISIWCIINKLSINPEKSKCLIFSNRKVPQTITITLNDKIIKIFSNVNYLGIFLDKRLCFSDHIDHLNSKLSQISGISYKLTYRFNLNTAKIYYYSFAFSLISYGIIAWGGILTNFSCERTFALHRRIVLNLFGWHFPQKNFEQICVALKLLGPIGIYKLELMLLYFNISKTSNFDHLSITEFKKTVQTHNIRKPAELKVPLPRTKVLKSHYEYNIPSIWNTIPIEIRNEPDSKRFKYSYKKYLLKEFHDLNSI